MENQVIKAPECFHDMRWNMQGGHMYYRCIKCAYIDGEKTFENFVNKEEVKKIFRKNVYITSFLKSTPVWLTAVDSDIDMYSPCITCAMPPSVMRDLHKSLEHAIHLVNNL